MPIDKRKLLDPRSKQVLAQIPTYAEPKSVNQLSRITGIPSMSVRRAVKRLILEGFIEEIPLNAKEMRYLARINLEPSIDEKVVRVTTSAGQFTLDQMIKGAAENPDHQAHTILYDTIGCLSYVGVLTNDQYHAASPDDRSTLTLGAGISVANCHAYMKELVRRAEAFAGLLHQLDEHPRLWREKKAWECFERPPTEEAYKELLATFERTYHNWVRKMEGRPSVEEEEAKARESAKQRFIESVFKEGDSE